MAHQEESGLYRTSDGRLFADANEAHDAEFGGPGGGPKIASSGPNMLSTDAFLNAMFKVVSIILLVPAVLTVIVNTFLWLFQGIVGRIWQSLVFAFGASLLVIAIIIPFAEPEIFPFKLPFFRLLFASPPSLWFKLYVGIAAIFAVVYFVWHYRVVRCMDGYMGLSPVLQGVFSIMFFGAVILGLFFDGSSNIRFLILIPLVGGIVYYFFSVLPYIKYEAQLRKEKKPLPEEEPGYRTDNRLFVWLAEFIFIRVVLLFVMFAGLGTLMYTIYAEFSIPLSLLGHNLDANAPVITMAVIFLGFPIVAFILIKYASPEDGFLDGYVKEGSVRRAVCKIIATLVFVISISGFVFWVRSWSVFNVNTFPQIVYRTIGLTEKSETGEIVPSKKILKAMEEKKETLPKWGIIYGTGTVNFMTEPNNNSEKIKEIPQMAVVTLTNQPVIGKKWVSARYQGSDGWIYSSQVKRVRSDNTADAKYRSSLINEPKGSSYTVIKGFGKGPNNIELTGRVHQDGYVEAKHEGKTGWISIRDIDF